MTEFKKGLIVGMVFMFAVLGIVDLLVSDGDSDSKAELNIYWQHGKDGKLYGEVYKATTVLTDNGKSIMDNGVYITCFELEYTDPSLTTERRF